MERLKEIKKYLNPADTVVIVFLLLITSLNLFFFQKIPEWQLNISINILIITFAVIFAILDSKTGIAVWTQLHLWYLVPFVFLSFQELHRMIGPLRGITYDDSLIIIDRFIFGTDPTKELFKIANPYLTELLQIVYGTFFFLPVILGIDFKMYKKADAFNYSAFIIVYGFTLSFIGYLLVPAIGPRFTLHDFAMNNLEMPGLFVTDFLREIVNSAEGIAAGTANPSLIVQRDCFPSGHTQMTLLVMFLSVKFRSRCKLFFILNGTLLIFATVYLRYHYVADLIGGLIFMLLTIWSGKYIFESWSGNPRESID
ncbi:MAG: phosphatase PAP2 family protein [Melioribacteraceae bacterium]